MESKPGIAGHLTNPPSTFEHHHRFTNAPSHEVSTMCQLCVGPSFCYDCRSVARKKWKHRCCVVEKTQRLCVLLVPVSTKEFNRGGLATMGLKICHTGETGSPCSSLSQRP